MKKYKNRGSQMWALLMVDDSPQILDIEACLILGIYKPLYIKAETARLILGKDEAPILGTDLIELH